MEAVSPNFVFLIIFIRQAVHIGFLRHGLVEGCVEDAYHGGVRHQLPAGVYAYQVGRVVQGGKVITLLHRRQHFAVYHHGAGEFLAAMHHAVPYRADFVQASHHSCPGIGKSLQHQANRLGVVGHGGDFSFLLAVLGGVGYHASIDADPLAEALGEALLGLGVNELEFQGGAPAIDY